MRLYHYLEARWALDDIRRRRIKFSKIDEMNDPYEWKSVFSGHQASQSALKEAERTALGRFGALCFGTCWNNILMWSHYGDRHKGICLGFDVADGFAQNVRYVRDVLPVGDITYINDATKVTDRGIYEEIIDRSFYVEYDGWQHEAEMRIHGECKEKDEETGHYFMNFEARLKLKEVIAGARFPLSKRPIEDALEGYSDDVRIIKAGRSDERLEIIVDERGFAT